MSFANFIMIAGLSADLVGVLMLGIDVIKIQRNLRLGAQSRFDAANEVLGEYDNFSQWIEKVKRNTDWREWNFDEGRPFVREDTFDYRAAQSSISEIMDAIHRVNESVSVIAELTVDAAIQDQHTAKRSILMSYVGLSLIAAGFLLQIIANTLT